MAPRNYGILRATGAHHADRGGIERRSRNAHTGASINTHRSIVSRDHRVMDALFRNYHRERTGERSWQARNVPLSKRSPNGTTGDYSLPHGQSAVRHDHLVRPYPQRGRCGRSQESLDYIDDRGGRGELPKPQAGTGPRRSAVHLTFNSIDDEMDTTNSLRTSTMPNKADVNFTQQSALFCDTQSQQRPTASIVPRPPSSNSPSHPFAALATFPSSVRLVNLPTHVVTSMNEIKPKRLVNNYRGKDPIKRLVTNKKLQAIFAGRGFPRDRKKALEDRPDLRMAVSRITK
ncbi:hypothetical protein BKA66DRAFT_575661 [Pyrenochaeta sp. MPI-SDFR-AT-0127]|nr:hypothetical protein BKA66DRAFT_575661 [Pyrenochaeta sp. MPI-SDFR-AT-0127]